MQLKMNLFVLFLLLCANTISSFTQRSIISRVAKTMQPHIYMTATDSPTSSNVDAFATSTTEKVVDIPKVPVSKTEVLDHSDEVIVDLDELSAESAFQAFKPKTDISSMFVSNTDRKAPRQAEWFPMLLAPKSLDGTFAGDVGFDPVGFAKDKASLYRMREAEIKHARLAMLAAAGWPLSELWHKEIANLLGLDSILAAADKAPSVLNGGLANGWIIAAGAFSLVIGALLELKTMNSAKNPLYKPGDLGFDPLGLHGFRGTFGLDPITDKTSREDKLRNAKKDMELCEIKHGRLAMLAITAYAMQEFVSGIPVVQQTPFFFGDPIV